MTTTPEELALDLSRSTFEVQQRTETKLRERATNILSAASIVVPIAAVAVGKGTALSGVLFGGAGLAYIGCAVECARALSPRDFVTGILGGKFLDYARGTGAKLPEMQATAASYLDYTHAQNQTVFERTADHVERAIVWLVIEIVAAAISLVVTIAH
jgi:hypothetical protein